MNHKNYTCALGNGPEYTVSQKLYKDFINYRGHLSQKLYLYMDCIEAVSRSLYHKYYTRSL